MAFPQGMFAFCTEENACASGLLLWLQGIETVRRDNCLLVRNLVTTCLEMILIERDEKGAREFVRRTISDLLMNRLDLSLLVITKVASSLFPPTTYAAQEPALSPAIYIDLSLLLLGGWHRAIRVVWGFGPLLWFCRVRLLLHLHMSSNGLHGCQGAHVRCCARKEGVRVVRQTSGQSSVGAGCLSVPLTAMLLRQRMFSFPGAITAD